MPGLVKTPGLRQQGKIIWAHFWAALSCFACSRAAFLSAFSRSLAAAAAALSSCVLPRPRFLQMPRTLPERRASSHQCAVQSQCFHRTPCGQ